MNDPKILANALVTADRLDQRREVMRDTDSAVMMGKAAETIRALVALAQPAVTSQGEDTDDEGGDAGKWPSRGWKS